MLPSRSYPSLGCAASRNRTRPGWIGASVISAIGPGGRGTVRLRADFFWGINKKGASTSEQRIIESVIANRSGLYRTARSGSAERRPGGDRRTQVGISGVAAPLHHTCAPGSWCPPSSAARPQIEKAVG